MLVRFLPDVTLAWGNDGARLELMQYKRGLEMTCRQMAADGIATCDAIVSFLLEYVTSRVEETRKQDYEY